MAYVIYSMQATGQRGEFLSSGQTRGHVIRAFNRIWPDKSFPDNAKLPRFGKDLAICWPGGGCFVAHQ